MSKRTMTNHDTHSVVVQNSKQKTKDRTTRTPLRNGMISDARKDNRFLLYM